MGLICINIFYITNTDDMQHTGRRDTYESKRCVTDEHHVENPPVTITASTSTKIVNTNATSESIKADRKELSKKEGMRCQKC